MKNNKKTLSRLFIILAAVIYLPVKAQSIHNAGTNTANTSQGPNSIVRNIIQDRMGNIYIASWQGVFRYYGKSFTNVTAKVSSARFFCLLEDKKGNLWFGSIGSGVYEYNGRSFRNFTTRDGLPDNGVTCIYEDKAGNIWFGGANGLVVYNGKSFRKLKINDAPPPTQADSVHISAYQHKLPENSWMHDDINAIVEDGTGKFWIGTRGYACIYDGKTFTTITNNNGKPFANVRSIIKDKKGNIWLGGNDGLWRYNGSIFTNFSKNFVGYVYEDRKGNIWTSSQQSSQPGKPFASSSTLGVYTQNICVLSRYDGNCLSSNRPSVTQIYLKASMLTGILEANDGSIWFGASDGVYRYNGKSVTGFNGE